MLAVLILGIGNTRACNITLFSFYSSFSKSWGEKNTFDSFLLFTAEVLSRSGTPHLKHTHTTKVKVFDCRNDWEKVKVIVAMTGKRWKWLSQWLGKGESVCRNDWEKVKVFDCRNDWEKVKVFDCCNDWEKVKVIVAMTGKRWKCLSQWLGEGESVWLLQWLGKGESVWLSQWLGSISGIW